MNFCSYRKKTIRRKQTLICTCTTVSSVLISREVSKKGERQQKSFNGMIRFTATLRLRPTILLTGAIVNGNTNNRKRNKKRKCSSA